MATRHGDQTMLLTRAEAAEFLRVSVATLALWARTGARLMVGRMLYGRACAENPLLARPVSRATGRLRGEPHDNPRA